MSSDPPLVNKKGGKKIPEADFEGGAESSWELEPGEGQQETPRLNKRDRRALEGLRVPPERPIGPIRAYCFIYVTPVGGRKKGGEKDVEESDPKAPGNKVGRPDAADQVSGTAGPRKAECRRYRWIVSFWRSWLLS